jgi:hypothetical protein
MKIRSSKHHCKKDNAGETGGAVSSSIPSKHKRFKTVRGVLKAIKKKAKRNGFNKPPNLDSQPIDKGPSNLPIPPSSTLATKSSDSPTRYPGSIPFSNATKSISKIVNANGHKTPPPVSEAKGCDAGTQHTQSTLEKSEITQATSSLTNQTHQEASAFAGSSVTSPRPTVPHRRTSGGNRKKLGGNQNPHGEDPSVTRMYRLIPELDTTKLPRGGISVDTEAVGRVQVSLFAYIYAGISIFSHSDLNLCSFCHITVIVWNTARNNQR